MQITVTFRHLETNEGLKDYVQGKVQRLQKYVENPREVHVVLSAEKFRHMAEITILGDGMTLNSQGRDRDLYAAVDQMVDKMERQIRERRGKDRRKRPGASASRNPPEAAEKLEEANEETEGTSLIQRRRVLAKPMSLEEAVAQMGVSKRDFLVFINSGSGMINVLLRSREGGYEWIEPHPK